MNETPRRLLRTARRLFAEKGFDATSVREITREAGCNLGAITYHFGSKDALYAAVLADSFGGLVQRVDRAAVAATGGGVPLTPPAGRGARARRGLSARRNGQAAGALREPLAAIEAIVRTVFAEIVSQPELQLLMLQQIAQNKAIPEPTQRNMGAMLGRVAELIREGQRQGTIRAGDARLMAVSVVSQPAYFNLIRRFAPGPLAGKGRRPRSPKQLVDHMVQFVRAGLARTR
jgi:AcrR family transcriptional regulator